MEKLAFLTVKKEFTESKNEVELLKSGNEFMIRIKCESMKTSKFYVHKKEEEARYQFTKACLFLLS